MPSTITRLTRTPTPPPPPQATALRYPLTAVSELTFSDPSGGRYACSGTVVGSDAKAVVTAAHCEYRTTQKVWCATSTLSPCLHLAAPHLARYAQLHSFSSILLL